jgi:hypothetical protein
MWTVQWDGDFVVGGDGNLRLTPSFRLKEFGGTNGKVRVHRELVSTLQLLRDRFGRPLSVARTDPSGEAVVISCDAVADLRTAATAMRDRGLFATVEDQPDGIRVTLPESAKRVPLALEQALETAFSVTAGFETAGDMFQQITGNFDGAGLSFGPAQVNFGSKTLVPLFQKFEAADEAALRACFADPDDYSDWQRITKASVADQIAFATGITTGRGGHDVVDPWKGYFQAVGRVPVFREIMVESILRDYGGKVARAIGQLRTLRPDITIDHLRCVCALYDLTVQQGSLDKAWAEIESRVKADGPATQFDLVRIAVEERGRKASEAWRADAESRRVGILMGLPVTVGDRQRANIQFYMLRDLHVSNVDKLVSGDIAPELARVRQAVASGGTLLA